MYVTSSSGQYPKAPPQLLIFLSLSTTVLARKEAAWICQDSSWSEAKKIKLIASHPICLKWPEVNSAGSRNDFPKEEMT